MMTGHAHSLSYRRTWLLGVVEPRLAPLLPLLIALFGIPTLFLTRWLASVYHPELWRHTIPTISKVAAYAPDSTVFATGMSMAAVCIVLAWPLAYVINRHRAEVYARSARERKTLSALAILAVVFGIAAGLFLAGLANISLEDDDPMHMLLSKLFFVSQVLAFVFDTFASRQLRGLSALRHGAPTFSLNVKPWLTLSVFLIALFFLFMFIFKDTGLIPSQHVVRILYTGAELLLATLCFIYPAAYYPEARDYFGSPFARPAVAVRAEAATEAEG